MVEAAIAAGSTTRNRAGLWAAQRYLGQAIRRLGLSREQLVITSKVLLAKAWPAPKTTCGAASSSWGSIGSTTWRCMASTGRAPRVGPAWPGQELISWVLEEGLADQVGFSSHGSNGLIAAAIRSGRFRFASLHLHLFDPARLPWRRRP